MNIQLFDEHRVAEYEDALKALMKTCMAHNFPTALPEAFYHEKLEGLKGYLRENHAYLFAAVEDSELLGFLWACELNSPQGRKFHVLYFATSEAVRGRGVGGELLRAAEEQARTLGIPQMELLVSADNADAVRFYQGHMYQTARFVLTKPLDNGEM